MEPVVGIFRSRREAEEAVNGLRCAGFDNNAITFVTPEHSNQELASVPTTDTERPGMGEVISGYIGGIVGGSVGLGVGSAIASLVVPGVGPVVAAGIGAAALLGVGGAAVGAAIGDKTEKALDTGVPRDDIFFYRELLKQGRSLVIASPANEDAAAAARGVLEKHGAEDVDSARKEWQSRLPDQAA